MTDTHPRDNHLETVTDAIDLLEHFRRLKNDPEYARQIAMDEAVDIMVHLIG